MWTAPLVQEESDRRSSARGRVLTCVRPLLKRDDARGPVWEFDGSDPHHTDALEGAHVTAGFSDPVSRPLRHTFPCLTLKRALKRGNGETGTVTINNRKLSRGFADYLVMVSVLAFGFVCFLCGFCLRNARMHLGSRKRTLVARQARGRIASCLVGGGLHRSYTRIALK